MTASNLPMDESTGLKSYFKEIVKNAEARSGADINLDKY